MANPKPSLKSFLAVLAATFAGCVLLRGGQPEASENAAVSRGRDIFLRRCAPCHGPQAKGDGPAAAALKASPPDLTAIQQPGQRFPSGRVMDIVEGSKVVRAHGSRTMPVWGKVFTSETGYSQAQEDLNSLVLYLESIQTHRDPR